MHVYMLYTFKSRNGWCFDDDDDDDEKNPNGDTRKIEKIIIQN